MKGNTNRRLLRPSGEVLPDWIDKCDTAFQIGRNNRIANALQSSLKQILGG